MRVSASAEVERIYDLQRLPELFCGFHRRPAERPALYPLACAPQAWAAAAPLLLLASCLGLEIDAPACRLLFRGPTLPQPLEHVRLLGLRVGDVEVDVTVHRRPEDVGVTVERRSGPVEIVVANSESIRTPVVTHCHNWRYEDIECAARTRGSH